MHEASEPWRRELRAVGGSAKNERTARGPEERLYEEWKRNGRHLEEYLSEFGGTAFLVFCVVAVVAWMFAPGSKMPHWIPSNGVRLFVTGLLLGAASWIAAISPPGKLSGAHLNPAVSLGFWTLGKMHARDAIWYVIAQMAGAPLGAYLAVRLTGHLAAQVKNATLHPGTSIGIGTAFWAETGVTFVLLSLVYLFVSHKKLMHWTPAMATVVVGVLVCIDGNVSGCGMNPARWFGPAVSAADWSLAWIYILGPILASVVAAGLRRSGIFTHPVPSTGKLYHDPGYRSVFKHDRAPSTPPKHIRRSAAESRTRNGES